MLDTVFVSKHLNHNYFATSRGSRFGQFFWHPYGRQIKIMKCVWVEKFKRLRINPSEEKSRS